jgi:hypothetical protein
MVHLACRVDLSCLDSGALQPREGNLLCELQHARGRHCNMDEEGLITLSTGLPEDDRWSPRKEMARMSMS